MQGKPYQKLIDERKSKGFTKKETAERAGISMQHYDFIERGLRLPSYKVMIQIANVFKVKPDYFFYKENQLKVKSKEKNNH